MLTRINFFSHVINTVIANYVQNCYSMDTIALSLIKVVVMTNLLPPQPAAMLHQQHDRSANTLTQCQRKIKYSMMGALLHVSRSRLVLSIL